MTIKILKECTAPISNMWYCGDVCRCSHQEWKDHRVFPGDEWEVDDGWGNGDKIKIDGLRFKEHYEIIQYP